MRRRFLLITSAVAIVTVSVAAYYRSNDADTAVRFATSPVTRGAVVETVEATGTLQAVETVEVSTQVSGTIKSLEADFNSQVHQGQVIARLEPSLFQTQVEQAQASLVRLQADAERARVEVEDSDVKLARAHELWDQQLIPRTDLETAEANARQAQASLKSAQAQVAQARASLNQMEVNMSHSIIRAPIDGIVISRNVDVGQTVAASTSAPTLFIIAKDLAYMQVKASIDESDIGRITTGQGVMFRVDAYPNETFSGKVSQVRLAPVIESNVVSYVTIIDVPNPALKLKPGMTANVTVEIARADNVLRVASSALRFQPARAGGPKDGRSKEQDPPYIRRPDAVDSTERSARLPVPVDPARRGDRTERGARVWIVRDGQPERVPVQTGVSNGAMTAILSGGLTEGEQVITGVTQATASAQTTASPLLPFGGRGRGNFTGGRQGATGQGAAAGATQGTGR